MYLLVSTEPWAAITAGEVKFSEAISWRVVFWRSSSRSMMSNSSRSSNRSKLCSVIGGVMGSGEGDGDEAVEQVVELGGQALVGRAGPPRGRPRRRRARSR